ncbi:MAG: dihydroorotate dehydrogenase-like protein [Candidatus Eisenbacteria bacterium]|nr:dihydroorotate dehydrogenase-like protein [Candidatus Eisenbacteria bacterium]
MVTLKTRYAGLEVRSPIVVGSSDLTDSVQRIRELEEHGAGAVVLGSIFEEEIALEYESVMEGLHQQGRNLIDYDYYDYKIRAQNLDAVTDLIRDAKRAVSIPVIPSINCVYSHEWTLFAQELEKAGADALELNMFFLPSDANRTSQETEQLYFEVVRKVRREISIPISIKMSYYFSSLARMIQRLSETGIASMVLFNRFYSPDFDIDTLKVVTSDTLSSEEEFPIALRWVALMAGRVSCELCASTGIHDSQTMIKQLLAGAHAVQVVSALYRHGPAHIRKMLDELQAWMAAKGFRSIDEFRGKLSQAQSADPALYERVQFMKFFSHG